MQIYQDDEIHHSHMHSQGDTHTHIYRLTHKKTHTHRYTDSRTSRHINTIQTHVQGDTHTHIQTHAQDRHLLDLTPNFNHMR